MTLKNLPKHIAVIPDGNRRWARQKKLPAFFGHWQGAKITEEILQEALNMKIPYLTFWGCSRDNITKRSTKEVNFLFELFKKHFERLAKDKRVHQSKAKINIFGQWQKLFPERVKKSMQKAIEVTKNYNRYHLTFLMAYDGTDEMTEAIKKTSQQKLKNPSLKIDKNLIKQNLSTKDLPPVDFVIRTGNKDDAHWSAGFMMWDCANAQLYFTDILFPAFNKKEFSKAIEDYSRRERRLGA